MSSDIKTILITSDKEKLSHQSVMALVIIFLASLIDGLDASIVTVALPKMSGYFGTSISDSSWFIFAYVVGLAAFLLPLGKMAKNNRVRKFMILGTALFGFSSFMCGISEMFWMLVAFRLLQGVSAAMMSCVLPSMVVHMLPADRKGLGMSVMGASTGIALILGPVLGGLITTYTTWHWLFFINIPICLIIIFLSTKNIPKDDEPDKEKDPTVIGGISAIRRTASRVFSGSPKAVSLKKPSPPGPKPLPGVVTTCASRRRRSKNVHESSPPVATQM